jgi:20S proteasome subunit beta 6
VSPAAAPVHSQPIEFAWSPYVDNGGTTLAVAGKDFCVIAADTRMSVGYSIHTRNQKKLAQLTEKCVIASSGMQSDIKTLHKTLETRITKYRQHHHKDMSTPALAQMLSNTLYYRRFFPYYSFNVVGGLDEQGRGCVYSYDAIGSYERTSYSSSGSGQTLVIPLLDNQVAFKNQNREKRELTLEEAVNLVKDAMTSAGERDIYTGDGVDIFKITKDGIDVEKFALKFD